ncbi:uncharacterized protein LOC131162580 [Malania oleifera]|uniref:uncharacterized protein LOC131162580 n=1 Tax=Malania oleifera TaxID=397392 RepID=UPI0025ADC8ED|nr:uncharacterized protein LOC131162580 [Malania oleifera]
MEVLSHMLVKANEGGLLKGLIIEWNNEILVISHLLFANDTIIICYDDLVQILNLICILLGFKAVIGLKENLDKREIIPMGPSDNGPFLAGILGCNLGIFPISYLGLPLGAKFKDKGVWDPIIGSFGRKLAGWKSNYISKGGRFTLIKSSLADLPVSGPCLIEVGSKTVTFGIRATLGGTIMWDKPIRPVGQGGQYLTGVGPKTVTYFMTLFPIPSAISKRLEGIQKRFLWGNTGEEFEYDVVKWGLVKRPMQTEGLKLRSLLTFNKALLGKWLWHV